MCELFGIDVWMLFIQVGYTALMNFDHMWVVNCDEMHIGAVSLDSALMSSITFEILNLMRFESEA